MHLLQKATQLTVDDAVLGHLYAYPDLASPVRPWWVRANMVSSLDGASARDGASAGLGGDGDRRIFTLLRELADVVLVGSGTVTGEGYQPIEPPEDSDGDRPPITLAVVSGSLRLDPASEALTSPNTLIATTASAPAERRRQLTEAGATLVDCGDETVELARVLEHLSSVGRSKVLCEGGPGLLGRMFAAGLVDDLCLTVGPTVLGGSAGRIAVSDDGSPVQTMRQEHILADDEGFLFTRWVCAAAAT